MCGCQFTLFSRRTGSQDLGGHARFRPHSPYGKGLVLGELEQLHQQSGANQLQTMIITALTQNTGCWEKQVSLDYIHYFAGGITGFICYWLTQTSYDLDQAVEALVAVTLGHGK